LVPAGWPAAVHLHKIFGGIAQSILDGSSTLRTCQVRRRQHRRRRLAAPSLGNYRAIPLLIECGSPERFTVPSSPARQGSVPDGNTENLTLSKRGFLAILQRGLGFGGLLCAYRRRIPSIDMVTRSRHTIDVNGHRSSSPRIGGEVVASELPFESDDAF
jgi:hypothetical protein